MLSYMLPTEDKPPPGDSNQGNYRASKLQKSPRERPPIASKPAGKVITVSPKKYVDSSRSIMIVSTKIEEHEDGDQQNRQDEQQQHHGVSAESPKHNGTVVKKSTLHTAKVTKDDSLYSINSDASTVGSDRKTSLKRVSFGSSKGSMVETLVYETPVQEEPEINRFMDHNGRIPSIIASVPDTDEGREMVRVSLLGPQPSPTTPGVFQVQPIAISRTQPIDMDTVPAELLTTHTEHTAPAYHTQISFEVFFPTRWRVRKAGNLSFLQQTQSEVPSNEHAHYPGDRTSCEERPYPSTSGSQTFKAETSFFYSRNDGVIRFLKEAISLLRTLKVSRNRGIGLDDLETRYEVVRTGLMDGGGLGPVSSEQK
ncbi:hypothetical protein WN48_08722 [Eufriesea mexicana]|nr:hypothetical protein WN48_08722 [Eufriesea mexicana]